MPAMADSVGFTEASYLIFKKWLSCSGGDLNVTRRKTQRARETTWWTAVGVLIVIAWYSGRPLIWVLPIFTWVVYELCFCPIACGVQTRDGTPCRNNANGRLFACRPSHWRLKRAVLLSWVGIRRPYRTVTLAPATPGGPAPVGSVRVDPNQRIMLYLTIIGTIAGVVQAVVSVV